VNYLLDTTVVSEWTKPRPNRGVFEWLATIDEDRVFVSVITLAELRFGVARLAAGRRKTRLDEWIARELPQRFGNRVLAIDAAVADAWGHLVAARDETGRPIGVMDAFLAATARVHDLTLVTRNASDFAGSVADVLNPWSDAH
jgi:toxin FitB